MNETEPMLKAAGSDATLGRETTGEVALVPKLRSALRKLNPGLGNRPFLSISANIAESRCRFYGFEPNELARRLGA